MHTHKWMMWSATVLLAGCVHVGPNLSRVNAVKTVAIVGLSGQVDLNDENSSGTVSAGLASIQGIQDISSPEVQQRRQKEAEATYDMLVAKLGPEVGWTVLPRTAVTSNEAMQKIFRDKMGPRRVNAGFRFGVPNVLWADVAYLSAAEQAELKTALGVDALIVAGFQVVSGRTYGYGVNGNGSFEVYPKAVVNFTVYDGGDDAIWREPYVAGPPTQGKVMRNMGMVQTENEVGVVVEAAQLAVDSLIGQLGAARAAKATAAISAQQ